MRKFIYFLAASMGINLVTYMNASYADSWTSLGEDCSELKGRFKNDPTPYAPRPFARSLTLQPVKYVDLRYISERQIMEVMLYDENDQVIGKREWLDRVCVDGAKVHHIVDVKGGEAGAYYTANMVTDIGIDSNGNLFLLENIQTIRTVFGLFPKKVKSENSFVYERNK